MPLPFIIPIIIVLCGTAAIASAIWKWDDIIIFLKGKNVVILGPAEVGKTTLHTFLRKGEIVESHKATGKEKVPKNRFRLEDLELNIKCGVDIAGRKSHLPEWKELFIKSDICIYMFDVSKVFNDDPDQEKNLFSHLYHLSQWRNQYKIKSKIYIIGTFADKIADYNLLNESTFQNFEEKIIEKIKDSLLQADIQASAVFIGSLKNQCNSEALVRKFLIQITGNI